MHQYYSTIKSIIGRVEDTYGLSDLSRAGVALNNLGIEEFIGEVLAKSNSLLPEQSTKLVLFSHPDLCVLAGTLMRLEFFNLRVLDFSRGGDNRTISKVMEIYSQEKTLNSETRESAGELLDVLVTFESNSKFFSQDLEYRMLRLFIVLAVCKNYMAASIIARVILQQLRVA